MKVGFEKLVSLGYPVGMCRIDVFILVQFLKNSYSVPTEFGLDRTL